MIANPANAVSDMGHRAACAMYNVFAGAFRAVNYMPRRRAGAENESGSQERQRPELTE